MDNTDTRTRTVKDYAEQTGQNPDSVRVRASRKLGRPVGQLSALTADEWAQVYGTKPVQKPYTPTKQEKSVLTQNPVAANVLPPGNTKADASASEVWELFAINFLEMALLTIGLARLYEWPGLVLAAMCCLFLYKAQQLARRPKLAEAGKNALNVVLAMCVASGLLHIVTFWNALEIQTKTFNDESEVVTDWLMFFLKITSAVLPAIFVAYISFNAVFTTAKIYRK